MCTKSRSVIYAAHEMEVTVGKPPRTLLSCLSLSIGELDQWAIVGANGCGKSVTAGMIAESLGQDAAIVSFDTQRQLLQLERRAFQESRLNVCHKRATVASYLFPQHHPALPEHHPDHKPSLARLSPIAAPFDAGAEHDLLADLEAASTSGEAGWLLREFGLESLRHQPVHGLSTGEGRKLMLVEHLLSPPKLLVLDEAFDGLDAQSRWRIIEVLSSWKQSALILISHHRVDYERLEPTHALLLQEAGGSSSGEWHVMKDDVAAFFQSVHQDEPKVDSTSSCYLKRLKEQPDSMLGEPLVEMNNVSIKYPTAVVFEPPISWTVREGEKWVVTGGNGSGK